MSSKAEAMHYLVGEMSFVSHFGKIIGLHVRTEKNREHVLMFFGRKLTLT